MIGGDLDYLVTSLPYLTFDDDETSQARVSNLLQKYAGDETGGVDLSEILNAEAAKFLPPDKRQLLSEISLDTIHKENFRKHNNNVLSAYAKFMYELKDDIRHLRLVRRNDPEHPVQKSRPIPIDPGTPLEEELQLLRIQWNKADDLAAGHETDFSALILYKIKLEILKRWWSFDEEHGFKAFAHITTQN